MTEIEIVSRAIFYLVYIDVTKTKESGGEISPFRFLCCVNEVIPSIIEKVNNGIINNYFIF